MKPGHEYEEHLTCGICVEPLDAQNRSHSNPAVHSKCWSVAHDRPRGRRRSFLDGHAARFRSSEYWDLSINKGRTNNPNLVWDPRVE